MACFIIEHIICFIYIIIILLVLAILALKLQRRILRHYDCTGDLLNAVEREARPHLGPHRARQHCAPVTRQV